ncbi:hypothetical protein HFO84_32895 [Rhizobium leguminosarum]|nr:hypothetical protein [Rhizobium leguminosarum]
MAEALRTGTLSFRELSLWHRKIEEKVTPIGEAGGWTRLPIAPRFGGAFKEKNGWDLIDGLWVTALSKTELPGSWPKLADDIKKSVSGEKHGVSGETLNETYGNYGKLKSDGSITIEPPKSGDRLTVGSIVPVRQSDLTVEEETVRAARVLAKQYAGPFAVLDERGAEEAEIVSPQERFDLVVKATDAERAYAAQTFKRIRKIVNGEMPDEENPKTPPKRPELVPPAAIVVAPPVRKENQTDAETAHEVRRATQDYGAWLQRRPNPSGKAVDQEKKKPEKEGTEDEVVTPPEVAPFPVYSDKEEEAFQQIRGVFFALQGDPILSRLFSLTFDFEMDADALPKGQYHLAIGDENGAAPGIPVATAAARTETGFWPLSVFAAQNSHSPKEYLPDLVEQEGGFWKIVPSADGEPRFELSSLDVRRSVASKTLGRDRGEAHQTGGFSILDRGRVEQIARDMALAEFNRTKEEAAVRILHAEELTIGRRLDVGVLTGGKIVWRSLMHRYVNYRFGKDDAAAEAVLGALIEDRLESKTKGLLEETSFQVAARIMPKPRTEGEATQSYEAVAEEAIFLWDGTPVSVLTDRGGDETKSTPSGLPFVRELDLPGRAIDEAKYRPPPLRFGVPYVFRFRSTFIGGGSPEPEAVSDDETIIPTQPSGSSARVGRRFLRHDSIASPILLLPRHLASKPHGPMGFEPLGEAIIRSWNSESSDLFDIYQPEVVKPTYVEGSDRTKPASTIRVFVPPEAPLDLVTRHGKLDSEKPADIRKGGLLDIAYTPRENHGRSFEDSELNPVPSGFPVAVSTRLDALDPDGVIYQRTIFNDPGKRGAPVFDPSGVNTTTEGQVGYLPDPAIEAYCLRAKVRDGDRYLAGHISVKLYDGTTYPHALPLVVKIARHEKRVRVPPSATINDLRLASRLTTIDADGNIPAAKGNKGARVQLVELALCRGEDFTLEVSCLPGEVEFEKRFSLPETMAMQLQRAFKEPDSKARLIAMGGTALGNACADATLKDHTGVGGGLVPDESLRYNVASKLIHSMREDWPIEEIAAVASLRICHAVNKPSADAINWTSSGETTKAIRPLSVTETRVKEPPPANEEGAIELGLDGTIEVDLDLVEAFQIVATAVGTDGFQIDSVDRGRSMISKRSGRWPTRIREDGCEVYERSTDVVGFKVDAAGVATLRREPVTLLAVSNLPSTKAIGPDLFRFEAEKVENRNKKIVRVRPNTTDWEKIGSLVFKPTENRHTTILLWPLFAAAMANSKVEQWVALPQHGLDRTNRIKQLQVQRPYTFADTLARKLKLDLVLVSRGASSFETAPSYVGGKEQALFRRQPLKREEQAMRAAASIEVWMDSTKRPAAPDVRRPEPSFVFTRYLKKVKDSDTVTHVVERHARTRLYLGRGWFDSGEDERLGVVLWPPNYDTLEWTELENNVVRLDGRKLNLEGFDDRDLGAGGAFATRWGGDPIRKDDPVQQSYFIPPDAFHDVRELQPVAKDKKTSKREPTNSTEVSANPHAPVFVRSALMPIPKAPTAENVEERQFLPVSLITYRPCFDLDREEWYVDVDLRATRASEPFVRFGLVRYQEHSILESLKTSEPVSVEIQLLPARTVEVCVEQVKSGADVRGVVTLKVSGRASGGVKEYQFDKLPKPDPLPKDWAPEKAFADLRLPKIRASVFHEAGEGNTLVRVPVAVEDWKSTRPGDSLPLEMAPPALDNNPGMTWKQSFSLTEAALRGLGAGRVVVYLEEFDLRMPASYREEPVKIETMFDKSTFVESGPRFSARVPFLELK